MRRFVTKLRPASPLLATSLLAASLLAACASGGTAPIESATTTTQNTVRLDGASSALYQAQLTHTDRATEADLGVTAERAYAVLPLVYEQIGLPVNTAVSASRIVGLTQQRVRRVGKDALSRFLTCGTDVTGASLADTYEVRLTVLSRVTPVGTEGSLLSTQVIGKAQPRSVSGTPVTCESTGVLEDRIAKLLTIRTAG